MPDRHLYDQDGFKAKPAAMGRIGLFCSFIFAPLDSGPTSVQVAESRS